MTIRWRQPVLAAALSFTAALAGMIVATPAHAQTTTTGAFSFSGDPDDYISGGLSYAYSTGNGDDIGVSSSPDSVHVSVNGANGDWWYLDFDAPGTDALTPGTYTGATRYPFNADGAGLSLFGNGRGCNTLTGSFTVIDAVFGPNGYVQTFDATFEQHCEGLPAAARGEVHISNPPPPPALELGLVVATAGIASTLDGNATVHGTVTCTKAATVSLGGSVVQVYKRLIARGGFSAQVSCEPGTTVPWSATAMPSGSVAFGKGSAEVTTTASGFDADYGQVVTVNDTTVVTLKNK